MTYSQKVLLTATVILGMFILGNIVRDYWIKDDGSCQYNIGCYVVNHSFNKTEGLINRISDVQHEESMNQMQVQALRGQINSTKDYHNQSMVLASSFEKYIKEIVEIQDFTLENTVILEQIGRAESDYLSCKKQILESYSQEDCLDNWSEYEHCYTRIQYVRFKIEALSNEHSAINAQITEFIRVPNKSISSLDLAKRIYNESMENNQLEKNKLGKRIEEAERLLRKKIYERDESSEKYELSSKNYKQCQESKKKHRACEQISKEVKKINSENIAYLQTMMTSKEQLLKNLQRIINSQKNSTEMQELNQKYHRHREEYISMFKEFISLTKENLKACGCTQQKEKQFKVQIQNLKRRYAECNREIIDLNRTVIDLSASMNKREAQRQEIVKNYKKALEYNENLPHQTETQLSRINKALQKKHSEIIQMRYAYKNIQNECNEIKSRMSRRVKEINKINDCINKKDFYLQLKHQANKYIHSQPTINKISQTKMKLKQYLLSF